MVMLGQGVDLDAIVGGDPKSTTVGIDAVIVRGWLSNFQKTRISTGRDWMDEYRADNITRAQQGKSGTEKLNKLIVFYDRMKTAGWEFDSFSDMLDFFFGLSRLMNVQELGYLTEEDFWANATASEITQYEGMWK